eukprot:7757-Heterococcus_DN1.PRE.3
MQQWQAAVVVHDGVNAGVYMSVAMHEAAVDTMTLLRNFPYTSLLRTAGVTCAVYSAIMLSSPSC